MARDEHGLSEDSLRGSEQYAASHVPLGLAGPGEPFEPTSVYELVAADAWSRTTPGRVVTRERPGVSIVVVNPEVSLADVPTENPEVSLADVPTENPS